MHSLSNISCYKI